jgi:precorrin-2 dehydrogenase/sirohydrochlorin ferrochelatase
MSYFPAYLKLNEMKILIVGGGYIATEKVEKLLEFTKDIKIIAKDISPQMKTYIDKFDLSFDLREYNRGDIKDFGVVIIAVDNLTLQKEIFDESRGSRTLCNAVDSVDYCDFIFPSFIKKDDLIVSISTSGTSPAFAKHFKRYLQDMIPDGIGEFLKQMKTLRSIHPKGKERMNMLDLKAKEYIESWED